MRSSLLELRRSISSNCIIFGVRTPECPEGTASYHFFPISTLFATFFISSLFYNLFGIMANVNFASGNRVCGKFLRKNVLFFLF